MIHEYKKDVCSSVNAFRHLESVFFGNFLIAYSDS